MMSRSFSVYTSLLTGDHIVTFGNEIYSEGVPVATFKREDDAKSLAAKLNHAVTTHVESYDGATRGGH